ncbi:MAG: ABC transporter ATP-binding protein [Desulfarculaceae bacterium]|nr:ABC transporter ATP-binding protein [Desulfarculaceae bacterium]MCF8048956.1 ABC transporter ATP-binding protein [Desulfarculaceae bacterium]MCF8065933.1 ABC transporter ATP-binding protein [Desulfarculaceae bacterium]MCF8099341.1 ABC transporter ATP-binding protein [Desulfarculaceae bacterium]MCF8122951.1 ABC transporter ATP-binding protein [Desulfarculaceae bacterium]
MESLLSIENLEVSFHTSHGVAQAVCGVSYDIGRGEVLGVVGESGSGKSVTALSVLRLVPYPGRISAGRINYEGRDLLQIPEKQMRKVRGDRISMIFQEPMISLNPAFTIENQLTEALHNHRKMSQKEARERAIEMLALVDIPDPAKRIKDYPHHLSGGMRQRVMIAEALLLDPDVLLADEPTTALDVTVQAQVLDLMHRLNERIGTAIMLITHNLGVVAESARRVVVMYCGRVVEQGPVKEIFEQARHPYTQGLLKSIPKPGGRGKLYEMDGIVPSLFELPTGCPFNPRCPQRRPECGKSAPPWREVQPGHHALCWLYA